MELSNYVRSDQYAAVIETEHGLLINGMSIPYVSHVSIESIGAGDGPKEVTIKFLTDSFIRLAGKPSDDFEKGLIPRPRCARDM